MFTVAQALTRLNADQQNVFATTYGTMSAAQQLAAVNEVLEAAYASESWRGVRQVIALTSSGGIISLPAGYLRAEGNITITTDGHEGNWFDIKPLEYQFQPNGPGYFDVTEAGCMGVAIDLGDVGGIRQYQLTGVAATLDTYAYKAVCRKRFLFITDTSTVVVPDCYSGLELLLRARAASKANANELAKDLRAQVYAMLDSDLGQFEQGNDFGVMQIDPMCAAPCYNAI